MPNGFPPSSILMKIVSISLITAFVLQVIALASNYWAYDSQNRRVGLFAYFFNTDMDQPDPAHVDPFTKVICPLVAVVSLIILFIACAIITILLQPRYHLAMPAVMIFSFVSGLGLLLVLTGWGVPHHAIGWRLSWAYGLTVIVAVLELFSSTLCMVEFIKLRSQFFARQRLSRHSSLENLNSQPEERDQEAETQEVDREEETVC